jgi:acetolactate synthase-1/3 small subunit
MTVVAEGEPEVLEQIEKHLAKLIDVRQIKMLPADSSVCRELILMKIAVNAQDRQQVIAIADIFRAKIVDVSLNSLMVELTGTQSKIDAFTNLLGQFRVLELARTGITGLSRGCTDEQ